LPPLLLFYLYACTLRSVWFLPAASPHCYFAMVFFVCFLFLISIL
jgi:hypothetical protein